VESVFFQDVYAFAGQPQELHPDKRHVLDKIRQQLQVLLDLGLIAFLGRRRSPGL
jgi:hypothetical protein